MRDTKQKSKSVLHRLKKGEHSKRLSDCIQKLSKRNDYPIRVKINKKSTNGIESIDTTVITCREDIICC